MPTVGIIDSQSMKTAEAGGPLSSVAGKNVKGRERHIAAGVEGAPLEKQVHPANIQGLDSGYSGGKLRLALEREGILLENEVVERKSEGFEVLHRRWVVEQTFA